MPQPLLQTEDMSSETTLPEKRAVSTPELSPRAVKWLESLDEKVRPRVLPGLYVRIANNIADRWSEPDLMRAYFDELLVDRRHDRAGFPDDIVMELSALKYHYDKDLFPLREDVWTKIWSGMN